jgi:hypothetical protein
MLSNYEKQDLFASFPTTIELSYDTPVHKKVFDYFIAIPEGPKCFAWFTVYKSKNICALLEIDKYKKIKGIDIVQTCFHNHLSYGTILYGTRFTKNRFCVEDIFYYKGRIIQKTTPYVEKLRLFKTLFQCELRQVAYTKHMLIFGLPMMADSSTKITYSELSYKVKEIHMRGAKDYQYTIHSVGNEQTHLINKNKENTVTNNPPSLGSINKSPKKPVEYTNNKQKERIFKVKADIQTDIYHLYDTNGNSDKYIDIAYIPSYETSVLMNSLFRNIKENRNLDLLEESDDEDEFENNQVDKFVFLEKEYTMACSYHYKFKKWVPLRVII